MLPWFVAKKLAEKKRFKGVLSPTSLKKKNHRSREPFFPVQVNEKSCWKYLVSELTDRWQHQQFPWNPSAQRCTVDVYIT